MSVESGFNAADIPLLPNWILVTEASEILKVSKQAVHGMIRAGDFESLHKIKQSDGNYIYVLDKAEIEAKAQERASKTLGGRIPAPLVGQLAS